MNEIPNLSTSKIPHHFVTFFSFFCQFLHLKITKILLTSRFKIFFYVVKIKKPSRKEKFPTL